VRRQARLSDPLLVYSSIDTLQKLKERLFYLTLSYRNSNSLNLRHRENFFGQMRLRGHLKQFRKAWLLRRMALPGAHWLISKSHIQMQLKLIAQFTFAIFTKSSPNNTRANQMLGLPGHSPITVIGEPPPVLQHMVRRYEPMQRSCNCRCVRSSRVPVMRQLGPNPLIPPRAGRCAHQ
jgi:hypothetical protein